MCGRYFVDSDTAREIEKTIRMVDEKLKMERYSKDIHPTESAPVILYEQGGMNLADKKWGFPGFDSRKVIFNARAESALEKKMFRESVLSRRIVIPASGFYEWNRKKRLLLPLISKTSRFCTWPVFIIITEQRIVL